MSNRIYRFLTPFIPFLILGLILSVFIGFIFIFAYVLMWGFILAACYWLFQTVRAFFFSPTRKTAEPIPTSSGRVIEHDEHK